MPNRSLPATADEGPHAAHPRVRDQLLNEATLTDPRFARDEEQTPLPGARLA